jgi:hypothetical protein
VKGNSINFFGDRQARASYDFLQMIFVMKNKAIRMQEQDIFTRYD